MLQIILEYMTEITCGAVIAGMIALGKVLVGLVRAVKALSHDMLYRHGEFYVLTDEITISEMKNLEYVYVGYHALGGNGTGTELFEKCKELPLVEQRTKWNPYYTERMRGDSDGNC